MVQALRKQRLTTLCGVLFLTSQLFTSQLFISAAWADDAATIADLKARERGRKVEPVIVNRLRSTRPALTSALVPP